MNPLPKSFNPLGLLAGLLLATATPVWAQVSLGSASGFSVLGGSNVTCTAGVVTGDIGVSPGSAVPYTNTGCTVAGATPPATNAAAVQARADFLSAYASVQSLPCTQVPGNLSGQNLAPGVYCTDAVAKAGTLTLTGPANGVWIFLVNGALTGTNFSVAMAGGGQPCNVYWAPTGAATLTDSALKGNILAGDATIGSITLTRGTLAGRALSNVALTMTGASVIGCGALTEPGKPGCHRKDHHGHHGHHGDKDHEDCGRHGDKHDRDCDVPRSGHHSPFKPNDKDHRDGRGGRS
ncbi:MAG: ice-binding family protein [Hylemonella sp.]|uniref:ice-binding family protein n=1 Tax=Hylemonella sp. TaxID=2066020 RepID=UPI0022C39D57|nr:ice-binding family protein [Hylemonella sp.]MCZ8252315.1 ice-binding family protein [Hylemonella sp.]